MLPSLLPPPIVETDYQRLGPRYRGKVRDVYRPGGGRLILITTDRISAFDHVLRQAIPLKGQVLNQLAAFFFRETADVCPNHVLAVPDPNVTIALECEPLPIEFVVRGYLAGHAWRVYREGERRLCGIALPDGLREGEALPESIFTPSTKAKEGHDEDISREDILARGLLDAETLEEATEMAFRLFRRGTELAARQGLLLVDTKYEFGRAPDGRLLAIDEVHTPDSSRYYYAEGYERRLSAGEPQRQLSKEFVREWLMAHGFQGKEGQRMPNLPPAFVREVATRYVELFERVTGAAFRPDLSGDPVARVAGVLRGLEVSNQ
jgi:phosphoribosylaminoimidazole-succinocarboxamide synthase